MKVVIFGVMAESSWVPERLCRAACLWGRVRFLAAAILLSGLAAQAEVRTWTDSLGRKFEGELIRVEGPAVFLKIRGVQRRFELGKLSAGDQEWLRSAGHSSRGPVVPSRQRGVGRSEIQANTAIPVKLVESNPAERRWVYESPNFRFICDADLGLATVREFVWMFEAVWIFCKEWPIRLPRLEGGERLRMQTQLVRNYEDYVRMGGAPNTGGVYLTARDLILIPFQSLGVEEVGGRYKVSRARQNYVLRHELTHQLMRGQTQQAAWFIEGAAEYVASVPFSVTRMLLTHHESEVQEYLALRQIQKSVHLDSLERFMTTNYAGFGRFSHAYGYSLIVFYYFAKLEGAKDGEKLRRYAEALHSGRSEVEARKHLLAGRTWRQLEADMVKAWNLKGLTLHFKR